jgi:Spy/CpxP family protein refolding chaperone
MKWLQTTIPFFCYVLLLICAVNLAAAQTTVPSPGAARVNQGQLQFPVMQRAMAQLDLSAEQRQQLVELLNQMRPKVQELRQKLQTGEAVQQEIQQLREEVRGKMEDILTPQQVEQFRQLIQQRSGQQQNINRPPTTKPAVADEINSNPSTKTSDAKTGGNDSDSAAKTSYAQKSSPLEIGSPAPDVRINELGGASVPLASFKGHVTVIEFGSLSAPTFRDHLAAIEKLKGEMGTRATFLIVYTREAYPAGQWDIDRNKEQNISVMQARDFTGRTALAQRARTTLKITLPMAVDSMEDEVARAFDAMPNGAVVLDKQGKIVTRQQWTNIEGLRAAIEQANQ